MIGRAQECKIKITHLEVKEVNLQTVSNKQCRILKGTPEVSLEDLSYNGTYNNGEIIGKGSKRILQNNDQISIISPHFRGMCINKTVI